MERIKKARFPILRKIRTRVSNFRGLHENVMITIQFIK
jgi:hypothetical protein